MNQNFQTFTLTLTFTVERAVSVDSGENVLNNKLLIDSLRLIHEIIVDAKQFGISLFDLKKTYMIRINNEICLISVLLRLLIDNFLVLAVGVVNRVSVAHEFKQHWAIESCRNQKGRGNSAIFENEKKNESTDEDMDTAAEGANLNEKEPRKRITTVKANETKSNESNFFKNYKPVCLTMALH